MSDISNSGGEARSLLLPLCRISLISSSKEVSSLAMIAGAEIQKVSKSNEGGRTCAKRRRTETGVTIGVGFVQGVIPFFCPALYPKRGPLQIEEKRSDEETSELRLCTGTRSEQRWQLRLSKSEYLGQQHREVSHSQFWGESSVTQLWQLVWNALCVLRPVERLCTVRGQEHNVLPRKQDRSELGPCSSTRTYNMTDHSTFIGFIDLAAAKHPNVH